MDRQQRCSRLHHPWRPGCTVAHCPEDEQPVARAAITVHLPAQPSNHQVATAFALEALPFDNAFSPALVRDSGAEVRTYVRSALANPRPEELKIITRRAADGATETVVAPDVWRPLCPAC